MQLQTIGIIHSCYQQKFAIPRQAGLVPSATGSIQLLKPWHGDNAIRGLDSFSHLWLLYGFHRHMGKRNAQTARPPRLGGQKRIGVFASRAPYRPNPIGLSLVHLEGIDKHGIHISGLDILDGSPLFDIKPYLPYADAKPEASHGWAKAKPERLPVYFSAQAASQAPALQQLIRETLALNPQPPQARQSELVSRIADHDVRWQVSEHGIDILSIKELEPVCAAS